MFLKRNKEKNGRTHLSITQSYRNSKGKSSNKTVKTLGYLDNLSKQWNMSEQDVLDKCKSICDQMTKEYNEAKAPVYIEVKPGLRVDAREENRKNLGCAVPLAYYNALGIEKVIRNTTDKLKTKYDMNSVLRLLVCERILNPRSMFSSYNNKENYFFKSAFSENDMYRSQKVFFGMKNKVIKAMNKGIKELGFRKKTKNVFYDVTNYYFEIDNETEQLRYGYSKEHRPNPIIQMGLLQDHNAIPYTFELFPGNTNDFDTMLPVLDNFKKEYNLDKIIMVSDKGNNTSINIAALASKQDGFIFSQSIRGTKSPKKIRDWVIEDKDYNHINEDYKIKSKIDKKTITISKEESYDGKAHKIDLDVKYVAFWSRKYDVRAKKERQRTIEKAYELVQNKPKYIAATNYGATKYVKGLVYDKETGEVKDTDISLTFDEEKLKEDEACDGYYCIVTSELDMDEEEIIETYRGLWQIEETFKISKSDLSARPVFSSLEEHINTHFLVCYVALTILRLMQNSLRKNYSANEIRTDLGKCCATLVDKNIWLFDHRDKNGLTDKLYKLIGKNPQLKWMYLNDIKKWFSKSVLPARHKDYEKMV